MFRNYFYWSYWKEIVCKGSDWVIASEWHVHGKYDQWSLSWSLEQYQNMQRQQERHHNSIPNDNTWATGTFFGQKIGQGHLFPQTNLKKIRLHSPCEKNHKTLLLKVKSLNGRNFFNNKVCSPYPLCKIFLVLVNFRPKYFWLKLKNRIF